MPDVLAIDRLVEPLRSYDRWRSSARGSWQGRLMVLGLQGVIALVVAFALRLVFGMPNNAVVNMFTLGFVVGGMLAGALAQLVWTILFFNVVGIILGLFFGAWINLPSWWRGAAESWAAGKTVPKMMFYSILVAWFIWIPAARGFSILWGRMISSLLQRISLRAKGEKAFREDAIRADAARSVMPSAAEAEHALAAARGAKEEGIILRTPKLRTDAAPVVEQAPVEVTDDDRSSLFESLSVASEEPLLDQLRERSAAEAASAPAVSPDLSKVGSESSAADLLAPSSPVAPVPPVAPSAPKRSPSAARAHRQRKLEQMTEIFLERIETAGSSHEVIEDFVRKFDGEIKGLSAEDMAILSEIDGGDLIIDMARTRQAEVPVLDPSIEERMEAFARMSNGLEDVPGAALAPPASLEPAAPPAETGSDNVASEKQELLLGKRLTSLLKKAQEASEGKKDDPDPAVSMSPSEVTAAALLADPAPVLEGPAQETESFGPSDEMMRHILGDSVAIPEAVPVPEAAAGEAMPQAEQVSAEAAVQPLADGIVLGSEIIPDDAPFGQRFGQPLPAQEDHDEVSYEEEPNEAVEAAVTTPSEASPLRDERTTKAGTMIPAAPSMAGSLPSFEDKIPEEEVMRDFSDVPVSKAHAREIFAVLSSMTDTDQAVQDLRDIDSRHPHKVSEAILSSDFRAHVNDRFAADCQHKFQSIRHEYDRDPVQEMLQKFESIEERLKALLNSTILSGDTRLRAIYFQVEPLLLELNSKPELYAPVFDVQARVQVLLRSCFEKVVKTGGESSAAATPVAAPVPVRSPLTHGDMSGAGHALSAFAAPGMSDKLQPHTPDAVHLRNRYNGTVDESVEAGQQVAVDAVVVESPQAVDDVMSFDVAPEVSETHVAGDFASEIPDASSFGEEAPSAIDSADTVSVPDNALQPPHEDESEDDGITDEDLDAPDPEFKPTFREGSVLWRNAKADHDRLIAFLHQKRAERDQRRAREAEEARLAALPALPGGVTFPDFSAEKEALLERERALAAGESDLQHRIAEREIFEAGLNSKSAELQADIARCEARKSEIDGLQDDLAQREAKVLADEQRVRDQAQALEEKFGGAGSIDPDVLEVVAGNMGSIGKTLSLVADVPADLRNQEIINQLLELGTVQATYTKILGLAQRNSGDQVSALQELGYSEDEASAFIPGKVATAVLVAQRADIAFNIINALARQMNIEPDRVMVDFKSELDKFGAGELAKTLLGYNSGGSTPTTYFMKAQEKLSSLKQYSAYSLSELSSMNEAVRHEREAAETLRSENRGLETSVANYQSQVEGLKEQIRSLEAQLGGQSGRPQPAPIPAPVPAPAPAPAPVPVAAPIASWFAPSEDDFLSRTGNLQVSALLSSVPGAVHHQEFSAYVINQTVFFYGVELEAGTDALFIPRLGDALDNVQRSMLSQNPSLMRQPWFAILVSLGLKEQVEEDLRGNCLSPAFDEVVNAILGSR